MLVKRNLIKINKPKGQPGFLGPGHTARPVVGGPFADSDPFIFLMDDVLDKKDNDPVGGPHPHAGFETVSLILDGEMGDDAHKMKAGDFQVMTAGSGIVHTETIEKKAKLRLLQLWLNLPKKDRWTVPRVQDLTLEHVPVFNEGGIYLRLYSGSLSGITSPVQNYSPLIVADISIASGISTVQRIPSDFNTFLYVIEGSVNIGETAQELHQDEVGWLDLFNDTSQSELKLSARENGVRLVLYAGRPTGENIVSHGPFIADRLEDIQQLYQDYRRGKMEHVSTLAESQRILL